VRAADPAPRPAAARDSDWLWAASESLCLAAQARRPRPSLVQRPGSSGPDFARVQDAHLNVPGPPLVAGLSGPPTPGGRRAPGPVVV
jgi:hypothetical protein